MKKLIKTTLSALLITTSFAATAQDFSSCLDALESATQKETMGTVIAKSNQDPRIRSKSTVKSLTTGVYKKYLLLSVVGNVPVAGAAVMGATEIVKKEMEEKKMAINVLAGSRILAESGTNAPSNMNDLSSSQVLESLKSLHEVREHIQAHFVNQIEERDISTQEFVEFIEEEAKRTEDNLFCKITKKGKLRIKGLGKKQLRQLQNRFLNR